MKTNTANYRTLIVTFAEPIRVLDNYFDDVEAWGVASLKEWIDGYESTRFTQTGEHTAIITSEYNMTHVKELQDIRAKAVSVPHKVCHNDRTTCHYLHFYHMLPDGTIFVFTNL